MTLCGFDRNDILVNRVDGQQATLRDDVLQDRDQQDRMGSAREVSDARSSRSRRLRTSLVLILSFIVINPLSADRLLFSIVFHCFFSPMQLCRRQPDQTESRGRWRDQTESRHQKTGQTVPVGRSRQTHVSRTSHVETHEP